MIVSSVTAGIINRYTSDFGWALVLIGTICMLTVYNILSKKFDGKLFAKYAHHIVLLIFSMSFVLQGFGGFSELWDGATNPEIFNKFVDFFTLW